MRRYQSASQARSPWWERTWARWDATWRWATRKRARRREATTTRWATIQPGAAAARSWRQDGDGACAWASAPASLSVGAGAGPAVDVAVRVVDAAGALTGPPGRARPLVSRRRVAVEGLALGAVVAGHDLGLLAGTEGGELGRQHGAAASQRPVAASPYQEDLMRAGRRHQAAGEGDGVGLLVGAGVVDPVHEPGRAPPRVGHLLDGGVEHAADP